MPGRELTIEPSEGTGGLSFCILRLGVLSLALPRISATIGATPVTLSDALLVAFYCVWVCQSVRGVHRVEWRAPVLSALSFLAALAVSLLASTLASPWGFVKLVAYGGYILQVAVWPTVVDSRAKVEKVLVAWALGAAASVVTGIVGLVAFYWDPGGVNTLLSCGYGSLSPGDLPRLCAPFRNSNMLENYLAVAVPLGLFALWDRLSSTVLVLGGLGALVVGALAMSNGFPALLAGSLAVLFNRWRPNRTMWRPAVLLASSVGTLAAAAILVFASVASVVPAGKGDFTWGDHGVAITGASRPSVWRAAWTTLREHPITGIGYGRPVALVSDPRAFVPATKLDKLLGSELAPQWLEAHNVWLNVAGQSGVLGLLALLVLLWVIWKPVGELTRSSSGDSRALAVVLLACFTGAFLFHGFFAAVEEARHVWALMALATSFVSISERSRRIPTVLSRSSVALHSDKTQQ